MPEGGALPVFSQLYAPWWLRVYMRWRQTREEKQQLELWKSRGAMEMGCKGKKLLSGSHRKG
jgi:hypothetical protein